MVQKGLVSGPARRKWAGMAWGHRTPQEPIAEKARIARFYCTQYIQINHTQYWRNKGIHLTAQGVARGQRHLNERHQPQRGSAKGFRACQTISSGILLDRIVSRLPLWTYTAVPLWPISSEVQLPRGGSLPQQSADPRIEKSFWTLKTAAFSSWFIQLQLICIEGANKRQMKLRALWLIWSHPI